VDGALTGIAPIRPLQLCADGGYQLRLGVLGVPLITVLDNSHELLTQRYSLQKERIPESIIIIITIKTIIILITICNHSISNQRSSQGCS
jgi:hypothetical protein